MATMAYTVKAFTPCRRCGQPTNRRLRAIRLPQCLDCSLRAMEDQTVGLAERKGEHFNAWRASMRRYGERLAAQDDSGPTV